MKLPSSLQSDEAWVYWKARGEYALGRHDKAQASYKSLADKFTFYGQLSAEELGRRITIPPRAQVVSASEYAQTRANHGL
jgi:soluble lytic murein transglycosylase